MSLKIEIVTPQKVVYKGIAESVTVPGSLGSFQVLKNHAPIVSSLGNGLVKIVENGSSTKWFVTSEGFIEVQKNNVSILVEKADDAAELDINTIKAEMDSVQNRLKTTTDKSETQQLKGDLQTQKTRLKAVQKVK